MKQIGSVTSKQAPINEICSYGVVRILSRAEVRALTGLSATTIWREIRAGRFPQPIVLSPNRKGFREDDIAAWVRGGTSKLQMRTWER
jgi:prophage regulatory protein